MSKELEQAARALIARAEPNTSFEYRFVPYALIKALEDALPELPKCVLSGCVGEPYFYVSSLNEARIRCPACGLRSEAVGLIWDDNSARARVESECWALWRGGD